MSRTSSDQLADNLHDAMMETIPSLVKEKVTEQVKKEVPAQVRDQVRVYLAEGLILERKTTKEETERLISKAILQERRRIQAQISLEIQNAIDNAIPSLFDASVRGKDIKVKKSKNKQKPTRNEETSDQEKDLKPISKAGSARHKEKVKLSQRRSKSRKSSQSLKINDHYTL
ncbi:hypothetical protein Tco_1462725 [Tanacetum coccineum]